MKTFRPDNQGEWPRADLRAIHEWIETSFRRHGADMPRVIAFAAGEFAYDDHQYETFFELAPGVIASARWDLTDEQKEELHLARWDTIHRDASSVGSAAADIAMHYLALGANRLADRLHDLRVQVRKQLAALASPGGGPRLISVRLTGGDWLHRDEFRVVLRLECLDRFLFTDVEELEFEDLGEIKEELEHWGRNAALGYALRQAFAAEGATGSIDLVTLNAIRMFDDVPSTLRTVGRGMTRWTSNEMELIGSDGRIWSHGADSASGLSWRGNRIRHTAIVPASVLLASIGRPVTDLITHPILTADMTIVEAAPDAQTGTVIIELQQPRWLFCHQSGRAWEGSATAVSATTMGQVDGPITGAGQ